MKNIMRQQIVQFILFYNLHVTIISLVHASESPIHGQQDIDPELQSLLSFIQMDVKEIFRDDDDLISFNELNHSDENLNTYAKAVIFHPPSLNFQSQPVGMSRMQRVIIQNLNVLSTIHLLSISGNTLHTHCSYFKDKSIHPGGNTSFDVVLLPREEGPIVDTLFIHTSLGSFKFQISGIGVSNPYRLRPFIGVRMPLNGNYTSLVYMHNPHSSTLQLTELYSSSGDLHLELPDDVIEATKTLWEIPPYQTKPMFKANFIARFEKNHTAFIRICTNYTESHYLLLPLEVDISSAPGIYCTEVLDFGILKTFDNPKSLTLSVINSGVKHVNIVNVIAAPVNEAIDIKFVPVKIPPDMINTEIATITFDPSKASSKQCCGKLFVKTKNNQYKLQIPYHVRLIKGYLDFNKNSTRFLIGFGNNIARLINVTSFFDEAIVIYSISLPEEAKTFFDVTFTGNTVLCPGDNVTVALLYLKPLQSDLQFNLYLRLHTNISYIDIPLRSFNGKLKVFLPYSNGENLIDFGTLGMGEKSSTIFALINENPVEVSIKFWQINRNNTYLELVGIDKGNASVLTWRQNFSSILRSLTLQPNHYAIFRITMTAPTEEGIFGGEAFVETLYQKISVPFSFRTARGALKVDELYFENSFPGKICTRNLYVNSTFPHSMTVKSVYTIPEDSRFIFDKIRNNSILQPNTKSLVGRIHFDYRNYCKSLCYSGLPTTTILGHKWLQGMTLSSDVAESDSELFQELYTRWRSVEDMKEKVTNFTFKLETTEIRSYFINSQSSLYWPRLFTTDTLQFPITQVGNNSLRDFTLENPSSLPLLVQIVPLSVYPQPSKIMKLLNDAYGEKFDILKHSNDSESFKLGDLRENNSKQATSFHAYRNSIEEFFGVDSNKKTISMLLTPAMRVKIAVAFYPKTEGNHSSLIIIRNNLTALDALLVHGKGGYGQIRLGNMIAGSDSMLFFELSSKHFKKCNVHNIRKYSKRAFSIKRRFTAQNIGDFSIYIHSFDINGLSCAGYGFQILNCHGFELKPNATKTVDIVFTPDFSIGIVERTLNILTNQNASKGKSFKFKLFAKVSSRFMKMCSDAVERPYWETYFKNFIFVACLAMIFIVVCLAYLDTKEYLHKEFYPILTFGIANETLKENIFDLRALSTETLNNDLSKSFIATNDMKNKSCPGLKAGRQNFSKRYRNIHLHNSDQYTLNISKHTRQKKNLEPKCKRPSFLLFNEDTLSSSLATQSIMNSNKDFSIYLKKYSNFQAHNPVNILSTSDTNTVVEFCKPEHVLFKSDATLEDVENSSSTTKSSLSVSASLESLSDDTSSVTTESSIGTNSFSSSSLAGSESSIFFITESQAFQTVQARKRLYFQSSSSSSSQNSEYSHKLLNIFDVKKRTSRRKKVKNARLRCPKLSIINAIDRAKNIERWRQCSSHYDHENELSVMPIKHFDDKNEEHANGVTKNLFSDVVKKNLCLETEDSCGIWPGFDLTPVKLNLWDPNYKPHIDTWPDEYNNINISMVSSIFPECNPYCKNAKESISELTMKQDSVALPETESKSDSIDVEFNLFGSPSGIWMQHFNEASKNIYTHTDTNSFSIYSDPSQTVEKDKLLEDTGEENISNNLYLK